MRPTFVTLAAVGQTQWLPIDYIQLAFGLTVAVTFDTVGALTYTVQHTIDDLSPAAYRLAASVSQTTTVITVTDNGPQGLGHGLVAGDYAQLQGTGFANIDGPYTVATAPTISTYTLTSAVSQTATGIPSSQVLTARVFNNTGLSAQTTKGLANYAFPITGVRLNITAYTAGRATLAVLQGAGP